MKTGFSVTYERWNQEALEAGDTDDRGFVVENVSLRDAIRIGLEYPHPKWCGACEPNDSRPEYVSWLTFHKWNDGTAEYYRTGVEESRSLHFPDDITETTRCRIARLFGVK